jgi:hypothetical protein
MSKRLENEKALTAEKAVIIHDSTSKAILRQAAAENSLANATGLNNV